MARGILMLISVSETGRITVDVRGPVQGKEGMKTILDEAKKIIDQGKFGAGRFRSSDQEAPQEGTVPDNPQA